MEYQDKDQKIVVETMQRFSEILSGIKNIGEIKFFHLYCRGYLQCLEDNDLTNQVNINSLKLWIEEELNKKGNEKE